MYSATTISVVRLLASQTAAFLALLLIASAIHKLLRPARTQEIMQQFAGVRRRFAAFAWLGVSLAELLAGVFLVLPGDRAAAALLAAAVWSGYLVLILRAIVQQRADVECGCSFGPSLRPLGIYHLARNAVLIGLAVLAAVVAPSGGVEVRGSELLAAAAFLSLYAALDQTMGLRPLHSGKLPTGALR
jgi:uncharacterized membrane protein YphA (DoxX/SURF4 family)